MNTIIRFTLLGALVDCTGAFSPFSSWGMRTTRRTSSPAVVVFMDDGGMYGDTSDFTVQLPVKESPVAENEEMIVDKIQGPLELTWDNVDAVLEEMRPFLIADGGNVAVKEIVGSVVKLELQGECGTCPSSTQTMKMGLEKGLMETIPEITEVIQDNPKGPDIDAEQVDIVLQNVRPYLEIFGSTIDLFEIQNANSLQPVITLQIKGDASGLKSTQQDIASRMQKHFILAGLRVEFKD